MKIIISVIDAKKDNKLDFDHLNTLNKLLLLEENLVITPSDLDRAFIVAAISKKIEQEEISLIQAFLNDEDLSKYIKIFDAEFENEIISYFNDVNITVDFSEHFWDYIGHQLIHFAAQVSNGCGNAKFNAPELIFTESCNIHDTMYRVTNTTEEKEQADDYFYDNMIEQSRERFGCLFPVFKLAAKIYYKSVDAFGKSSTNIED